MKLLYLFILLLVTFNVTANAINAQFWSYYHLNAATTMWNYLQKLRGHDYDEAYKEYIDRFSPIDKFSSLLEDPRSADGKNLLSFCSALESVAEMGDNTMLERLIAKYQSTFPNDWMGLLALGRTCEEIKIVYSDKTIFWKIPTDGKSQNRLISDGVCLCYTEELVRKLTKGGAENACRITLWRKNIDGEERIGEFYPSSYETLFVFSKKKSNGFFVLLRKRLLEEEKSIITTPFSVTQYHWSLYYVNLQITNAKLNSSISFLGTFGVHNKLQRIEWIREADVKLYFRDWYLDETKNMRTSK